MKWNKIPILVLVVAMLSALLMSPGISAESDAPAQDSCRYYYQLEPLADASADRSVFALYVARSDPSREALHAGNIALALPSRFSGGEVSQLMNFTPHSGWSVTGPEQGKTQSGQAYLSFGWYCVSNGTPQDDPAGRQLLGQLEVSIGGLNPGDHIQLLPWPETVTGGDRVRAWQNAAASGGDVEAALETVRRTWRMPNANQVSQGYYQGYYVPAIPPSGELPEESQVEVDLTATWQRFIVGAYAPQRAIRLDFYRSGETTPAATAHSAADAGTGHFRRSIDFTALEYRDAQGTAVDVRTLTGTYDLVVSKQSHVTCTLRNLQLQNGECPALNGVVLELPCGDTDENGEIGEKDRALLTVPNRYSGQGSGQILFDLNGDGWVDQRDLAILIAPANYGKRNFTIDFTSDRV